MKPKRYDIDGYDWECNEDPEGDWVQAEEAEARIEYLRGQLRATESLLDRAMTLIPEAEDLEDLISLAWDTDSLNDDELALIHRFETLVGKL